MKCPHCKNNLIQKSETGVKVRLDGPVEIDDTNNAIAKCHWCKKRVEIPLELKKSFVDERFVVERP